jgi:HSP20 family molecular chaperone IbpA
MLPSIFGNNLFDDFFDDSFDRMPAPRGAHDPFFDKPMQNLMKTDVKDCEDHYEIMMDLPGFKKEDLQIKMKDGYLSVQAAKTANNDEKDSNGRYIRRERFTGSCSRSFYVGDLKAEDISAKFENGILNLNLPKKDQPENVPTDTIAID